MIEAWIGLGANLGNRAATLDAALTLMDRLDGTSLQAVSRYYFTPPWGDTDQPEFLNAVARLRTELPAELLLHGLQAIESELGRKRSERRWGPRSIDLDLLVYGGERHQQPGLTVPHPRIRERAFVLIPLVELSPQLSIPGQGRADALLAQLDDNERSGIRPGPRPGYQPTANDRRDEPMSADRPVTMPSLAAMKAEGRAITMLTAYDASFAQLIDAAGVDCVLVGDSLGNVIQGRDSTLPVTVEEMAYHTGAVRRGLKRALLVTDLPFMSYHDRGSAMHSAALVMRAGAQMVKLEGGAAHAETVAVLVANGVPVCAHLGLTPQHVHQLGGYRVQGRDEEPARRLKADARILAEAGAGMLVLECVPAPLAREVAQALSIPVIGIGAGSEVDGQVLVLYDMLGITPGRAPKFVHDFMAEAGDVRAALAAYVSAVREGRFPAAEHAWQ